MKQYLIAALLVLNPLLSGVAATWHVAPEGSDNNDGTSPAAAFGSIQHGLDQMRSGDTLILAPGEYFEATTISDIGSADATTTIRAAIPGTAVLRGDIPAPVFKRADGYDFVYVTTLDTDLPVQVVNVRDRIRILQAAGNITELEFKPGSFYYDGDSRKLFLSTNDASPPEQHEITLTLLRGPGLYVENATNLRIEGIGFTGFNIGALIEGGAGIVLQDCRDSVIRNCTAWFNGFGIEIRSKEKDSGGNVVESCLTWGNSSPFANDFPRSGISALHHKSDTIRSSEAYYNTGVGIYLRNVRSDADASGSELSRLVDNLVWGNQTDLKIKTNPGQAAIERGIGGSVEARSNPRSGLYRELTGIDAIEEWPADTIFLDHEEELVMEDEFADPQNRDYRLQSTSRFRGSGPDGSDRGPLPYEATVYFVSQAGNDTHDGLSTATAWQTLEYAVSELRPGDTLYIEPGSYAGKLSLSTKGTVEEPVSIRGRGRKPVHIEGPVRIENSSNLELLRLHLEQPVAIQDGRAITISHCTFSGKTGVTAHSTQGLTIEHCEFGKGTQPAVTSHGVAGLTLSGNRIRATIPPAVVNDAETTVRYADYNAFPYPPRQGWQSLPSATAEGHSLNTAVKSGLTDITAKLKTGGPLGQPIGPYSLDTLEQPLELLEGPRLHSISATTANIEWLSSLPCEVELAWGTNPDQLENRETIDADSFGTFSLIGLKPATRYYFKILTLRDSTLKVSRDTAQVLFKAVSTTPEADPLTLTTAAIDAEPVTWHVSADGDDRNDGTRADAPLATIQAAANRANVGDTVLIGAGEYVEQVRIRSTGAPGKPITFRAAGDARVVMAPGPTEMKDAFSLNNKSHLRFDLINLLSMRFDLYRANDIEISRIFAGGRPGTRAYIPGFLHASLCNGLRVTNCVTVSSFNGPHLKGCDDVLIRNSVFYRALIAQLIVESLPGASVTIEKCIFTDGIEKKGGAPMIDLGRSVGFREQNNCFYPRYSRWDEKAIIRLYSDFASERALEAYNIPVPDKTVEHPVIEELTRMNFADTQAYFGDHGSILANPEFAGLAEYPSTDEEGKPVYTVDRMTGNRGVIPFENFFATNPELIERDIGLQREAF